SAYLRSLNPTDASGLLSLAWAFATDTGPSPDPHLASEAVSLAQHACELMSSPSSLALDCLAAAYAAQGRFEEAVKVMDAAIRLAREGNTVAEETSALEARRSLYARGERFRSPRP
ncbi:MAG: tetratricopeptide repeat protein, partial [Planctomycetota bacterium]